MAEELPDAPWAAPASTKAAPPDAPWAAPMAPSAPAEPSQSALVNRFREAGKPFKPIADAFRSVIDHPFASPVTDIPREMGHAAVESATDINDRLNPFSKAYREGQASGAWTGPGTFLGTGKGLLSAVGAIPNVLLNAPARSLLGHPLSAAMPTATPEEQAKLLQRGAADSMIPGATTAENYEKAKGGVDLAMMGLGARGGVRPSNAPALPPVEPGAPMGGAEMLGARNQRYWREGPGVEPPPAPSSITIPEGAPVATPRENLGVRLLPAEAAHAAHVPVPLTPAEQAAQTLRRFGYDDPTIATMGPGTQLRTAEMLERNYPGGPQGESWGGLGTSRNAGAAGTEMGPLADVSPATITKLREVLKEEGFTPYTLEQRLAEMSAHEFLGELSPTTRLHMSGIQSVPGAAKNEIVGSVTQRSREAGERMGSAFDRAFGKGENREQLSRTIKIDRDKAEHPFWDKFRSTQIKPTPELEALLPRLEEAGALHAANRALGIEGRPKSVGFERMGNTYVPENPMITTGAPPPARTQMPTAEAFQYAKEHLDKLIEHAMESPSGANEARRLTALKNALVGAIDKHPDASVAGVWKEAREAHAGPTQLLSALKLGEKVLTGNVHAEELPFLTASYSPAELKAFNIGVRGRLEDLAGKPGKTENTVINTVLAPSNQSKIRWAIGDEKADALIAAIEHEQRMHHAPNNLIYNSMTAPRQEAVKHWTPQATPLDAMSVGDVVGAVTSPKTALMKGANAVLGNRLAKRADKRAAEFAKLRDEAARVFTLQGAERDAVLRHLLEVPPEISGHATGGRVFVRASGGRVNGANVATNPTEAQKAAGNYAKDHVRVHGLDLTIENQRGSMRRGVDKSGKPWSVRVPAHYGYIKGTVGKDKDHVDAYLGPHPKAPTVYVIDQNNAETGAFDEHKCFIGFGGKPAAISTYRKAFSDGKADARLGAVHEMSIGAFKVWLETGDTTAPIKAEANKTKMLHTAVGYVAKSRVRGEACAGCAMFIDADDGLACTLVRDPISPAGWCRRFARKETA